MSETATAQVWTCDGCSSWTDRPVTRTELLNDWGWVEGENDDDPALGDYLYCPECQ